MDIREWVDLQHSLQVDSFAIDPVTMEGEELAQFITWNAWALVSELDELLRNVQWKPWAVRRGLIKDKEEAKKELADMMHFFGNLVLAFKVDPDELADAYARKVEINRERQLVGYDTFKEDKDT